MLEVIVIMVLCNTNRKNALRRGRKPGGFVALTVALWLGLELVGLLIGFAAGMELGAYLLGILFAGIGGLTAYLIAKNCRVGDFVLPARKAAADILADAETLDAPATVEIIRDRSMVGALVVFPLTLNGRPLESVRNGKSITVQTNRKHNILSMTDAYGTELPAFMFDMESGGHARIHFKAGRFVPRAAEGTLPVSVQTTPAAM
jgi:hypothetical protein